MLNTLLIPDAQQNRELLNLTHSQGEDTTFRGFDFVFDQALGLYAISIKDHLLAPPKSLSDLKFTHLVKIKRNSPVTKAADGSYLNISAGMNARVDTRYDHGARVQDFRLVDEWGKSLPGTDINVKLTILNQMFDALLADELSRFNRTMIKYKE